MHFFPLNFNIDAMQVFFVFDFFIVYQIVRFSGQPLLYCSSYNTSVIIFDQLI